MKPGMTHFLRSSLERAAVLSVLLGSAAAVTGCDRFKKKSSDAERAAEQEEQKPRVVRADFRTICEGKPGPAAGAPYVAGSGKVAPAVFFFDEEGKGFDETAMDNVEVWKGSTWQAETPDDAQLVVCATQVSQTKVERYCNYVDDKGTTSSIPMASRELKVAIYEAKTGKKLDAYDLTVPRPNTCDYSRSKYAPATHARAWAASVAPIVLGPYQPTDAAAPKIENDEMWAACAGRPIASAAPYDATGGTKNKVAWYRRFDEKSYLDTIHILTGVESAGWREKAELPPLVGCIDVTRGKKLRDCQFEGGKTLTLHEATWNYRIVEARTGKVLGEKALVGRSTFCPFSWNFSDGDADDARADGADKFVAAIANATGGAAATSTAPRGGFPPPAFNGGSVPGPSRPAGRPAPARPSFGDQL
jgi:hypothetical protein